jgi:predicted Zn-dependent peptidase
LGKSVLGNQKSLKQVNSHKIKSFFQNHYTMPKTVLVAAGNIKHQSLLDWFGQEVEAEAALADTEQAEELAPQEEGQVKVQHKKTEQVHLCIGAQVFHARHPDRFALAVLDGLLGGGMSSRLFQEIREKRGLAYSVYSYHSLFIETGLIGAYVGTRPDNVKEALKIVKAEFERLGNDSLTEEEVEKVKNQLKGRLILSMESTSARMNRLGKSYLAHREILSLDQLIKRVESIEKEDIQRIARTYLTPDKITVAAIGPIKASELS